MSFTYSHGHQVPWDQYQTDIVKKNEEIAQLKEDARTNLDYSVKYEKDLVKKNEEIAELKAGFHELQEVKEELKDVPLCKSLIEKVKYIKGLNMEMGAGLVPELKAKIKELDFKLQVGWFDRDMKIFDLKTDNDVLKADYKELKAKMNLSPCLYAVQYEKDLVKKNEEIAELKAENEKLKDEDKCVMDMLEPAIKEEVALLTKQNKTLEDIHNGDMKIAIMLKQKWNEEQEKVAELKAENEELKILTKWRDWRGRYDKLKAENEKLQDRLDEIGGWMSEEQGAFGSGAVNSFWKAFNPPNDEDSDEDSGEEWDEDFEKEQMSAMVKEVKVGEGYEDSGEEYDWPATHQLKDVKVGEGDVGWEKY